MVAQHLYIGKYVKEVGQIRTIGRSTNTQNATVHIGPVVCFVTYSDAAGLNEGQTVAVVGRISAIGGGVQGAHGGFLQLHSCRFAPMHLRGESDLP